MAAIRGILLAGVCMAISTSTMSVCYAPEAFGVEQQAICENEALRAQLGSSALPDCRAYEMVTPSYKQGYQIFAPSLSSNGEGMLLRSLATVAEQLGTGETPVGGSVYLNTRTADGWHISPLNPPQARFAGQVPAAFEADDGDTLWIQHRTDQSALVADLYMRSADGVFHLIGPLASGENVGEGGSSVLDAEYSPPVGATSDYGHILIPARPLSEYSGYNNLMPVPVPVEGEKGSTKLIGHCGDSLGALRGSAYNAVSRDGETVFVTVLQKGNGCTEAAPASTGIYARIHGAVTSPLEAETIDVSESVCSVSCGGESGKNFEGASEDGMRVYFTSTQKLTNTAADGTSSGDATNKEGCPGMPVGQDGCNLYVYDFEAPLGSRLSLVAKGEVLGVAGVSEDGSHVYFVSRSALASAVSNPYGKRPEAEQPNLYVYDATAGTTAFIATLVEGDGLDWQREFHRPVEVAGKSGQYMLFVSVAPGVTPDDSSTRTQLFEYKAESSGVPAELARVTKGEDGFSEDGNAVSSGIIPLSIANIAKTLGQNVDFKSTTNSLNISEDGKTVFFETSGELSPRAVSAAQGCLSVYEFHTPSGRLSDATVRLISDGRDVQLNNGASCGATFLRMDPTGANLLFITSDALLPADVDGGQRDIYDARIEGGFAPLRAGGLCGPGLCEGASSGVPALAVAGSAGESGEAPLPALLGKGVSARKHKGSTHSRKRSARSRKRCKQNRQRRRTACSRAARRRATFKLRLTDSQEAK